MTPLTFVINRYSSILKNDMRASFRISAGSDSYDGHPFTPDIYGHYSVDGVPIPNTRAMMTVSLVQREQVAITGSCDIAPDGGKRLYVFIDPDLDSRPVTQSITTQQQNIGPSTTIARGGESTAQIMPDGIGLGSKLSRTETTTGPSQNTSTQRTQTQQVEQTAVALKVTVMQRAPQQLSERADGRTGEV